MTTPEGEGGGGSEPSFADVLNNVTLGGGRPRRRRRRGQESPPDEQPQADPGEQPAAAQSTSLPPQVALPTGPTATAQAEPEEDWGDLGLGREDAEAAGVTVRPYAWTGGRTRPVYDLAVETLVSTSDHGRDVAALTSVEHRSVAELCREPRSVAEVAALLSLPLGVARVVLGDMADIGLVAVHRTAGSTGDVPDLALMERVLSGLRRL